MPRTKLEAVNQRGEELVKLIWGTMCASGLTVTDLAEKTGFSRTMLYHRKKSPEEFTVREIRQICRSLNIPIEEVRAAFRY